METIKNIILIGLSIITVPLASKAVDSDKIDIKNYDLPVFRVEGILSLPAPAHSPIPVLSSGLAGTSIDLKITINEQGIPVLVDTAKPLFSLGLVNEKERDFAVQMMQAVSNWTFAPALDSAGNPVAVKVLMPVKVVEKNGMPVTQVAFVLQEYVVYDS